MVLLGGTALADTTITFDDLPVGTIVTNQYANVGGTGQGVVFGPLPGGAGDGAAPVIESAPPGQAHSGTQVADISCSSCEGSYTPDATATFADPRSQVSVYVGFLGDLDNSCAAGSTLRNCAVVTLTAYDASGDVIATSPAATVTEGAGVDTLLSVSTPTAAIVGFEVSARSPTDNYADIAIDDLTFSSSPDFTLTPQTASVTVAHGQSVSDPIAIGRIAGSTGAIQLQVSALPAGVQAQFSSDPADAESTLTLTANSTVEAPAGGPPTLTVTGTPLSTAAGTTPHSFSLTITIESVCADVLTGQDLVDALQSGCPVVNVDDSARIDLAYMELHSDQFPGFEAVHTSGGDPLAAVLDIPSGVTLESDRSPTRQGGVLYMSQNLTYPIAMLELGQGSRVMGLRLLGYSFGSGRDETYTIGRTFGTTDALNISEPDVLVDNNEIAGWPGSGVFVHDVHYQNWPPPSGVVNEPHPPAHSQEDELIAALASEVHITDNFIHNNVGCTDGYGVNIGGDSGFALIDYNVFDYNKHDVAGGGAPGTGYIASSNLTLTDGVECRGDNGTGSLDYGGHFDMHGTAGGTGSGHVGGTAGTYIEIRNNAIRGDQRYDFHFGIAFYRRTAFDLRGTPTDKAIFEDNVTEASSGNAVAISGSSNLASHGKLIIKGNQYGVDTSQQLAVGNFGDDGCSDVFLATGVTWWYSPCGRGQWRYLNASGLRLNRLAFGDFNGDGKTDVFTQSGDRWLVSYGGTGPWTPLPVGSNIPMSEYRFGDFTGNGKTDIFRANGKRFYISVGGATPWKPLVASHLAINQLRFCDFTGNGQTDVFSLANHQWSISYGGATAWHRLNKELSSNLDQLVFGDFNGDGRCDIARAHGRGFQVSWGGTTPWQQVYTRYQSQASFSGTLLGNFDGGNRTEVLEYAIGGTALERYELMSDFGPFEDWSQQNLL